MAIIEIRLENSRQQSIRQIHSDLGPLDGVLASVEADPSFPCLGFVDPYGDTLFNRVQLLQLTKEIDKLQSGLSTTGADHVLVELREMAEWGANHPHHYLRMRGD